MARPGDPASEKRQIRDAMRLRRERVDPGEVAAASGAITDRLLVLLGDARRVGVFASVRGEATFDAAALRDAGLALAWPVAEHAVRGLRFYSGAAPPTTPGAFGIPEPERVDEVLPTQFDAVLVPGLAFGRQGGRLGYGGGFYDRFLPKLPVGALRVGVCYGWQVLDIVPVQPHDVPMTHVVTESEIVTTGR